MIAATAAAAAILINGARQATVRALDAEAGARQLAEEQSGLALDAVRSITRASAATSSSSSRRWRACASPCCGPP